MDSQGSVRRITGNNTRHLLFHMGVLHKGIKSSHWRHIPTTEMGRLGKPVYKWFERFHYQCGLLSYPFYYSGHLCGGILITAITTGDVGLDVIGAAMGGFALSFILIFVSSFLLPMALAMYAKEDSMGAAFRFGELLSRIKSVLGDYVIVFIVVFILFTVLGMIANIPFLGFLIFIFGKFYLFIVAADMYGKIYTQSKA